MCAAAVQKAVQRLDGVEKATVSLNHGLATLKLKPQNHLSLDALRRRVRDAGFTAGPIQVTALGEITRWQNRPAFQVTGRHDLIFLLATNPPGHLPATAGAPVTVTGTVLPAPVKGQPDTLQVTKFETPGNQ